MLNMTEEESSKTMNRCIFLLLAATLLLAPLAVRAAEPAAPQGPTLSLKNDRLAIEWRQSPEGWRIGQVSVKHDQQWQPLASPSGENTLLYAAEKPSATPEATFKDNQGQEFPGPAYHYQKNQWAQATNPVALNTAGKAFHFFPREATQSAPNTLRFTQETDVATVVTEWTLDAACPSDLRVKQTLTVKKPGYFSTTSPSVVTVAESDLAWATVPGYFQGDRHPAGFRARLCLRPGRPRASGRLPRALRHHAVPDDQHQGGPDRRRDPRTRPRPRPLGAG